MSKLLLGMMVFVILKPFEMQATDLGSSSFHSFSASIPLSHFSKLDIVHHSIHACIENEFIVYACIRKDEKSKLYTRSMYNEEFSSLRFELWI